LDAGFTPNLVRIARRFTATPGELPNSPAAKVAGEWLRLCQAPSQDLFTHWIVANVALDSEAMAAGIARENADFCRDNGGLEGIEVVESSARKLTLRANGTQSGVWYQLCGLSTTKTRSMTVENLQLLHRRRAYRAT